ncbi:MAG: DUF3307 domain-containing protein [Sulfitobacter sp.]
MLIQSFILLLLAHLLADFVFQTNWMVANKRRPAVLALHGGIVFILSAAALGGQLPLALGLAAAHLAIDAIKTYAAPPRLWAYLGDQAAHLATVMFAAYFAGQALVPPLPPELLHLALIAAGLLAATLAGAPAVGLLMAPFRLPAEPEGLENAGQIIGLLERGLIFGMVMIGEPAGVGFLIAAKSILRFDTVSKNQKISEYVIIGTLASFGWAMMWPLRCNWPPGVWAIEIAGHRPYLRDKGDLHYVRHSRQTSRYDYTQGCGPDHQADAVSGPCGPADWHQKGRLCGHGIYHGICRRGGSER